MEEIQNENQLETNNNNNGKIYKIIALIVVLALAGCAFYFFYWTKTPQYSLNIIKEAVEKHDVVTFEKHVDTETLCTQAFDAFLNQSMPETDKNNPFVQGLLQTIKPTIVTALKDGFTEYVRTGNLDLKNPFEDKKQNNQLTKEESNNVENYQRLQFKDVNNVETDGNRATVDLLFYDTKTEKDFTIKIGMAKLEDGTWRVDSLVDFETFVNEFDKATKEKLAEINKQIEAEIAQNVIWDASNPNARANLQTQNLFGLIKGDVTVPIPLKNLTNQPVTVKNVQIQFIDNSNNQVVYEVPFTANITISPNQTATTTASFELNPFIDKDTNLIKVFTNTKNNIIITSIGVADRTIIYQTKL